MVQAMVLGGLRRCEVLGLRLEDLRLGEWRVFIADGKGGHQRLVPLSTSFFTTVAAYMDAERPAGAATDRVFVVLKGQNRGRPLSADGLDEIITAARARAGLTHGTCHELRHTCLTRLREHGMSLEALQAQAGHRSIASTQMYLHLGADWLAERVSAGGRSDRGPGAGGDAAMSAATAPEPIDTSTSTSRAPVVTAGLGEGRLEGSPGGRRSLAATMTAYLDQLTVSSRPATVSAASLVLRQFADHVTGSDPACTSVAAVERRHIEDYKIALAARPGRDGGTVTTETIRNNLGMLRTFFERIIDWDDPDAPRRVPVLAGDLPKANEPLPKFLDDPTAAKFMAALAVEPNRRRRLIVELLARTGMRVGELGGLRDDAMYRLGDTYWLRIPLGKLHNERTVPLHPMLVGLINDYRAWRGPTATGLLVERDDHQPMDRRTIYRHVAAVARRAGVARPPARPAAHPGHPMHQPGHVTRSDRRPARTPLTTNDACLRPHLRHHRRRAVLHRHRRRRSRHRPPRSGNRRRHRTCRRLHRRLLGNGHCTRPLELDCRFQTICESCGFYETGPEFVTILRRQRDDAAAHTDHARTNLYDDLIAVIDDSAAATPTPSINSETEAPHRRRRAVDPPPRAIGTRNRPLRSPQSRETTPRGMDGAGDSIPVTAAIGEEASRQPPPSVLR